MTKLYDCIIIGGGPAALAASIYLARQKIKFTIITKDVGGQTLLSSDVENYLGYHFMKGSELVEQFRAHIADYKIELQEGEEVLKILKNKNKTFTVRTRKTKYSAKTILVATGKQPKKLNISGENEFYGKGVTYCATCDAPLFAGKEVAVIGGGNSAMDAALLLEKYCKKISILTINPELSGDKIMLQKIKHGKKIMIIPNARTTRIFGDKFVKGMSYSQNGQEKQLKTQGVFVEIGLTPSSQMIDFVKKNKWGEILVDKKNMTSVKGVFAAGDVTDVCEKQIIVAAGEGAKAALDIIQYLNVEVQEY